MVKETARLRRIWAGMKQRCYNPKSYGYRYYGAKGIKMCETWVKSFQEFVAWAYSNGYTDDLSNDRANALTIDRIDPNKDYCPENCRWIPAGLNASLSQAKKYGRSEEWCHEHWNDHHRHPPDHSKE